MSIDDPDQKQSAPRWQRLPGPVQLKLAHMIADHLRTHRSANYADLRDHPEFSPWFGTHLGHRGDKRFDRMVRSVEASQPKKSSRRSASEPGRAETPAPLSPEQLAWSAAKQHAYAAGAPIEECSAPSAARQLAHAGAPSFEELISGLNRRRMELEISLSGCVNEFGEIVAAKLHKQYSAEFRAMTLAMADLSKRYHDALSDSAVLEPMFKRILDRGDPEATRQAATEANALLKRSTGLQAIRSAS